MLVGIRELSELQDEDVEVRELIQLVKCGSLTNVLGKGKPDLSRFTLFETRQEGADQG